MTLGELSADYDIEDATAMYQMYIVCKYCCVCGCFPLFEHCHSLSRSYIGTVHGSRLPRSAYKHYALQSRHAVTARLLTRRRYDGRSQRSNSPRPSLCFNVHPRVLQSPADDKTEQLFTTLVRSSRRLSRNWKLAIAVESPKQVVCWKN